MFSPPAGMRECYVRARADTLLESQGRLGGVCRHITELASKPSESCALTGYMCAVGYFASREDFLFTVNKLHQRREHLGFGPVYTSCLSAPGIAGSSPETLAYLFLCGTWGLTVIFTAWPDAQSWKHAPTCTHGAPLIALSSPLGDFASHCERLPF